MSIKKTVKRGFTIVELLIVIVVIGILATIVIVTYQGVQNKANTTKNQTNAKEVKDKAEAYNSLETEYPANAAVFSADDADPTVKLGAQVQAAVDAGAPAEDNRDGISYTACGDPATGAQISYWSYETKKVVTETIGEGCPAP